MTSPRSSSDANGAACQRATALHLHLPVAGSWCDGSSPRYDQRQSAERSPSNSNLIARQSSWATSTHHLKSTPSVVCAPTNSTPSDTMGAPATTIVQLDSLAAVSCPEVEF
jgi:hypothetical protein